MTLNSSGPISFGGSTTGQSINLELGVSATALASINSTSFRTLAGVASGQISLSNFYGKSNATYWFASFKTPFIYGYSGHTINSSNGNIVFSTTTNAINPYYSTVYRVANSGSLLGYNTFSQNGPNPAFADANTNGAASIVVDSSCIVYGAMSYVTFLTKYSPVTSTFYFSQRNNMTLQRGIITTNGTNYYVDYSKVFGCCCCSYSGIVAYNSSGTPISGNGVASNLGGRSFTYSPNGAGSFYLATDSGVIVKQTTTSITWLWSMPASTQAYAISANSTYLAFIQISSAIALYNVASATNTTPPTKIAYLNVSGSSAFFVQKVGVCYDSSNNFYYLQNLNSSGQYGYLVTKLNSSGTVQWQRTITVFLSGSNSTSYSPCITCTGQYLNISFYSPGSASINAVGLLQYPLDGSKTGTYTAGTLSIVVAASSYTYTTNATNGSQGYSLGNTLPTISICGAGSTGATGISVSSTNTFTTI